MKSMTPRLLVGFIVGAKTYCTFDFASDQLALEVGNVTLDTD